MRNTMTYTHQSQFLEMFGNPMTDSDSAPKLSDNVTLVLGSTPNSKTEKYWNGSLPWITPAELTDNSFEVSDTERRITEEGADSANLTEMPVGTVLFSTRAPIGKTAITTAPMYCNQGFKNMICGEKINNVFLYYTLKLNKEYLQSLGTGTTFKELSKAVIEKLHLEIPPMELQTQFETIYRQADKSKFDGFKSQFLEMFGNPNYNEKGLPTTSLSKIADNWDSKRIPITSGNRISGIYPYYGASGIVDYVHDYIFDDKLLLISEDGANLKDRVTPIAFTVEGKCWVNNHAHILKFEDEDSRIYVEYFINYLNVEKYLTGMAQPKLNQERMNAIPITDPCEDYKKQFASIVRQADKSKYYELN